MSDVPGQSGHALPDLHRPVCATNGSREAIGSPVAVSDHRWWHDNEKAAGPKC
jgi:hypothetical protein